MLNAIRVFFGTIMFVILLPFLILRSRFSRRNQREYGLIQVDRSYEISRKFGVANAPRVLSALQQVDEPSEKVLGAIIFLASRVEQIEQLVSMANTNRDKLLSAAALKDERG